jgi:putative transposase
MPNYKRAFVPGGTYFFTLVTSARRPIFSNLTATSIFGEVFREAKQIWPMEINAIVLLPDHLHMILSLPSGDDQYSKRIGWIKKEFTKRWLSSGGSEAQVSTAERNERRKGVWQPRFWEHTIQDDDDFDRHFDYVHWNPVKHGCAVCPRDWQPSSFHRWVKAGVYPLDWGCSKGNSSTTPPANVAKVKHAGEP